MLAHALAIILAAAPQAPPPAAGERSVALRGSLVRYFTAEDYPAAALRAEEEGGVGFRLDVGPDGRATHCAITESSGSGALDSATCRILRARVRFGPVRDPAGNPARGVAEGRIVWALPGGHRAPRFGLPVPARPAVAAAPIAAYARPRDYPAAALRAGEQGIAYVRLIVGLDGRVAACEIAQTSGSAALDAASCAVLRRRARYAPAAGLGGPVCDVDEGGMVWTLPRRARLRGRAGRAAAPPPASPPSFETGAVVRACQEAGR